MDGRPTWTDCDEDGDYVVPNVLSPRDLVFRPDNMDETVPHTLSGVFKHCNVHVYKTNECILHMARSYEELTRGCCIHCNV